MWGSVFNSVLGTYFMDSLPSSGWLVVASLSYKRIYEVPTMNGSLWLTPVYSMLCQQGRISNNRLVFYPLTARSGCK